jgi:IS30 family transposase
MIEVRLRDGLSTRAIARDLGRSAGMILDEINRHGGKKAYRARGAATQAALDPKLQSALIQPSRKTFMSLASFAGPRE